MTQIACQPATVTREDPMPSVVALSGTRSRAGAARFSGLEEPALPELMDDPMLRRLMASDGVRLDHLIALIADARLRLAR